MGVFSCMIGLSDFFFTGFRKVPGHVPRLPTISAVSPKPSWISFSFQGDSLAGFILLFRIPIPPFIIKKYIHFGWQYLWTMILAVYVAVVHVNPHLGVSYFFWVLYQSDFQELFLWIFLWPKVVYYARVLSYWSVILGDDDRGIFEDLK